MQNVLLSPAENPDFLSPQITTFLTKPWTPPWSNWTDQNRAWHFEVVLLNKPVFV